MNDYIIGIPEVNHDPAACILKDGKLIAMAEEERFIRIKHADGIFPTNAINFCLDYARINMQDVARIAVGWDCNEYLDEVPKLYDQLKEKYKDIMDAESMEWMDSKLIMYTPTAYTRYVTDNLLKAGFFEQDIPKIEFIDHHYCHALTAYHFSGFDDAIVLTMDGHGQRNCTVLWDVRAGEFKKIKEIEIPHSLGWYYSAFTSFLGFKPYDGEGKTMGLAPYGKINKKYRTVVEKIIKQTVDGYEIDPSWICYGPKTKNKYYTDKLAAAIGDQAVNGVFEDRHKDVAFEAQRELEEVALHLVNIGIKKTGLKKLCLAGGVAYNCKMNGYIWKNSDLTDIFVMPMSGDAGSSLGAAMAVCINEFGITKFDKMEHVYYGPNYSNEKIEESLKNYDINYRKSNKIEKEIAKMIADGKIIGWFQGRMEVGPRALGNRSILVDPRKSEMKDLVNNKVKFREPWRPFCPSLLDERAEDYLVKCHEAPFMILTFDAKEPEKIPAVVHVDNTLRPQRVKREVNPRYWKLIKEFEKITGEGIILNTSFNIKGDPMVCSPDHAIECFLKTGMEVLAIGDYVVTKNG